MLQIIRDRFTGVIALVIIGVIAVSLVISFGNMDQAAVTGNVPAEVNGEAIDALTYQRAVQNQLARQQEALQGGLPEAIQEQIQRSVLESLVRNTVVTQYVRDAGFRIADQRLMDAISRQPVFQVGGSFSKESYEAVLASQGLAPEYFENQQRALMAVGQLEDAILTSSFFTPTEYRRYIELLAEERDVDMILLDPAKLAADVTVGDEDVQAYYEANPDEFRTEESVSLDYVEIRLDDIAAQVSIDEQDVRDYYDANSDRYVAAEQRQGRHILIAIDDDTDEISALALAVELGGRLAGGEKFETLAGEFSDDPVSAEQGGNLGWSGRGDFVDEAIEEAMYGLEIGSISDPVRTAFGYHIIRLDDVKSGSVRSFDEMRDELFDELAKQEATDRYYALAEKVDDLTLENPMSLGAVESETGLKVQRIEEFTRNGGGSFGYDASMVDAAFSVSVLEDGENSPLIETADDSAVVLRVAEHRPSVLQSLETVRESAEASVRLQLAGDVARERGEEILARLEAGATLADLATEFGFEVRQLDALKRNSSEVRAELLAEIFRTRHPKNGVKVFRGHSLAGGGYSVFQLNSVRAGRADEIPQDARDQRKQQLARQSGTNAVSALATQLREKSEIIIAPGLFDRPETL